MLFLMRLIIFYCFKTKGILKMKKMKILLPLAMLALLFGTVACGNNQGGGNGGGNSTAQTEKITITAAEGKTKLILGETVQLTASVSGVSWSSSNETIATIDANGLVTSKAVGKTTIKATKNGYKDGTLTINIDLQNITITAANNKTALVIGEKVQLTADQQGVSWESANPDIASISANGEVEALKAGEAVISAKKDGYNTGKITITVSRPAANLIVDMTTGAEHYSADGWWSITSSSMGYAVESGGGATPITQTQSWGQDTESDTYISAFGVGDKETIKFTSSKAAKAELLMNIGNSDAVTLADVVSIKLNDKAINLAGIALEAHTQDFGGFAMATTEFADISFGEVDLVANENTLVFEFIAETNLCLNEMSLYAGDATVTLVNPPVKEQIAVNEAALSVIEGETVQIVTAVSDVIYVAVDETIATVDNTGKVTGVKVGKTSVTVKKEGMYSIRVEITVNPKPVAGQILVEAELAEELLGETTPEGVYISKDGQGWGGNEVHSGSAYVSFYGATEVTLTYKFTAETAQTMVLSVVGAAPVSFGGDSAPYVIKESMQITLNEAEVTAPEEAAFPAPEGWTATMSEVTIGDVAVNAGENVLVIKLANTFPSLDVFKLSLKA